MYPQTSAVTDVHIKSVWNQLFTDERDNISDSSLGFSIAEKAAGLKYKILSFLLWSSFRDRRHCDTWGESEELLRLESEELSRFGSWLCRLLTYSPWTSPWTSGRPAPWEDNIHRGYLQINGKSQDTRLSVKVLSNCNVFACIVKSLLWVLS